VHSDTGTVPTVRIGTGRRRAPDQGFPHGTAPLVAGAYTVVLTTCAR